MSIESFFGPEETDSEADDEDENDVPSERDSDSDFEDGQPRTSPGPEAIMIHNLMSLLRTRTTPRRTATSTRRTSTTANHELRSPAAHGAA